MMISFLVHYLILNVTSLLCVLTFYTLLLILWWVKLYACSMLYNLMCDIVIIHILMCFQWNSFVLWGTELWIPNYMYVCSVLIACFCEWGITLILCELCFHPLRIYDYLYIITNFYMDVWLVWIILSQLWVYVMSIYYNYYWPYFRFWSWLVYFLYRISIFDDFKLTMLFLFLKL